MSLEYYVRKESQLHELFRFFGVHVKNCVQTEMSVYISSDQPIKSQLWNNFLKHTHTQICQASG